MKKTTQIQRSIVAVSALRLSLLATVILISCTGESKKDGQSPGLNSDSNSSPAEASVDLTASQLKAIKIEPVSTYPFPMEREAVGAIAYDENRPVMSDDPSVSSPVFEHSPKWIVATVSESDIALIRIDQPIEARVVAYPGRAFEGKVSALGGSVYDSGGKPAVDPNTHRVTVRCEISDPKNELYSGMLARIVIQVQKPVESVAIPMNGVVRNGDGTMAAWVTSDRHHFVQRIIKIGLQKDGQYQVLEGLKTGELAVTDGAVFLSNILYAPPDD